MIDVKLKYLSNKISRPEYATRGSIGMDLASASDGPKVVKPGERVIIPVGIAVQIPKGYGGFVFARSGLSVKKGLTLCNGVGVIDNDYTGEIKLAMVNISDSDYTVNPGDRIAQLVFLPVEIANLVIVDELTQTQRGDKGFGSTGK